MFRVKRHPLHVFQNRTFAISFKRDKNDFHFTDFFSQNNFQFKAKKIVRR